MTEGVFLIATILLLIILLIFFSVIRSASRIRQSRGRTGAGGESPVGFVVDTFHDLMAKLKEKEKELEALRKKAEERADAIESYNEYILQSVPSGVISLDRDLTIRKLNSAAERILNIRAEEAIGKSYREVLREPFQSLLGGETLIERGQIPYTTETGKTIHIGLSVTPLMNEDKEVIGQLIVFTDLTELKALESQAALRDRLSSLGEMAAGIAHEMRNPMGVIAGYTKILTKKVDPALNQIVGSIAQEIGVMDRIISDFLSFAKPSELNISSVHLDRLIETCVANGIGERTDITAEMSLSGIPPVAGDEVQLRQAFTNLVQNALEAMPRGGELHIHAKANAESLEVTVADTGHGIPDEIRSKIFLPFYTTKDRGTGLGLAITHRIIESHRGTIDYDSSGKGTRFRVRLPLNTP